MKNFRKKEFIELGMGLLVLVGAYFLGSVGGSLAAQSRQAMSGGVINQTTATEDSMAGSQGGEVTVMIDPGHGGDDPGKIGINGALEKDLNLAISGKLQEILTKNGVTSQLTRKTKEGLYDVGTSNKKQQDMKKRCALIDAANPRFTVSIHQNSYTSEPVRGPQVFYYSQSTEGQKIAKYIQDALNQDLQIDRPREIKANDSYYLLKKTKSPTVIVECGFLSNQEEAEKLVTEKYQQKVAEAVSHGVCAYLDGNSNSLDRPELSRK